MKHILLLTLLLQGCGVWGAKEYNRTGTVLMVEGTDCRITYSEGKVFGGPGVSSQRDDIDLHQGIEPR